MLACGGNQTSWESSDQGGFTHYTATERTQSKGLATFVFEVEPEHDALLLTADAEAPYGVFVRELIDPNGVVVYNATELAEQPNSITGAQFADTLSNLNWPVLLEHDAIYPGTWTATAGALDDEFFLTKRVDIEAGLTLKPDDDFTVGTLHVRVVYASGADDDAELVRATEGAVEQFVAMYAEFGIEVVVTWDTYDGVIEDSTGGGDGAEYLNLSSQSPLGTLDLVVLSDFSNWNGVFGLSGGIPGALIPTGRSAVAVSGFVNSGPDMQFSDPEIRLFAETMAHEMDHYIGAFHPVEQSWANWDGVSDTIECQTETACITEFRNNLMFPFPICSNTICAPQSELSIGQQAVMHHYTGVR